MDRIQQNLLIAKAVSMRGNCARRKTGCVITDRRGHILSTGYNGVAPNVVHCDIERCPGVGYPSGEGLDKCQAIHAEQNALLQCTELHRARTLYSVTGICMTCIKLLAVTPIVDIYYIEQYAHDYDAFAYWTEIMDRRMVQIELEYSIVEREARL